jgi:broad specificity phosphatase PhoE
LRDDEGMGQLVLVRHTRPVVDDRTAGSEWPLTNDAIRDAQLLGATLSNDLLAATVFTSPERKARETAAWVFPGRVAVVRDELAEVRRPWYATAADLSSAAAGYLSGKQIEGWEPQEEVVARVESLRTELLSSERCVIVGHGTLMTVWLDHEIGLDDPLTFWTRLRMPDAWALDLSSRALERIA